MNLNYKKEYTKFHNIFVNAEKKNIENHLRHYEIIEDMIGVQHWLYDKITTHYNSDMNYSRNHVADAMIHGLFYHNLLSLYASFLTTQQSLLHQSVVNLRTVYESIPKMYYISFFPNEIKYMILRDHIDGNDITNAIKYLKSENALLVFEQTELNNPKHLINQVKPKYYFKWFNHEIYTEEQINKAKSAYALLSISSHGSLVRRQQGEEEAKDNTGDLFEFIELLSFFNILAELNGHELLMKEKWSEYHEIIDFMKEMRAKLVKDGKMGSLFPDHPNVAKKVWIHPPGSSWE